MKAQGNVSTVVVFFQWQWDNMFLLSFPSLIQASHSLSSWMRGVRLLCWRTTKEKEEERGTRGNVTAGWRAVWVCEGSSELPLLLLSCYSSSSLCFLPLTGPWPFLREPFWGRKRCPRSCSVHGTPPCPSSLSRSESECIRAEEVGAGTGFMRAGRRQVEDRKKR